MIGQLEFRTEHADGRKHKGQFYCKDCNEPYHAKTTAIAVCNGTEINRCPWCREDSKPYHAGRGI